MTVAMMTTETKHQLASLDEITKRQLLAYLRNQIFILTASADNVVNGDNADAVDACVVIAKTSRKMLAEMEELLAKRQADANLGGRHG